MLGHKASIAWKDRNPHIPGWALEQRLTFIERKLFWQDHINRRELQDAFRISPQQASNDLQLYRKATFRRGADGREITNTMYDGSEKAYVRLDPFEPRFEEPDAHKYLLEIFGSNSPTLMSPTESEALYEGIPFVAPPDLPRNRKMDPEIVREILTASRNGHDIEIAYSSPTEPQETYFRITPASFGYDGFRWHVHAFRHDRRIYRDLSLDRVREVGRTCDTDASELPFDTLWAETIEIVLAPNPGLDEASRRHIEEQYGMEGGEIRVSVRRAFIPYFLKRYQLEEEQTGMAPHQRPLAILNRADVNDAMPPHMRIPPETD